ncbi:glycosyltransferase [Janibacter melonis]|uniref:glycosyltransferase n=1 Tax=Janibacter melonis TaxID=262209 RepID=UPI00177D994B
MTGRGLQPGDTPVGRVPGPDTHRRARLEVEREGWTLRRPRRRTRRGRWSDGPDALCERLPDLDEVHALDVVSGSGRAGPAGAGAVEDVVSPFARRAAARGTLVLCELPDHLAAAVPVALGSVTGRPGDLAFDIAAVRQRRSVLADALPATPPSVTAVVASRRPHLLQRVARMLAAQTYPSLDVVVVVHGADPGRLPSVEVPGREVVVIAAPADRSLGHALALGSAAASGDLVTKLDDDDFYGPDHVLDLVLAHRTSGAALVGKSTTVVHLEDLDVTVRRVFVPPESYVHRVAGGTILVSRGDLMTLGGWSDVPRAVDSALMRSARAAGASIYRPHDIGYVYVRQRHSSALEHTWAADAGHFLVSTREQWLGLLRHPELGTATT